MATSSQKAAHRAFHTFFLGIHFLKAFLCSEKPNWENACRKNGSEAKRPRLRVL